MYGDDSRARRCHCPPDMAVILAARAAAVGRRSVRARVAAHVRHRRLRRAPAGPGRGRRGAAPAGVPRLRLRRDRPGRPRDGGAIATEKRAGKLANLEKAIADAPLPGVDHRHRAHPLGHPRRPQRRQRPPPPRRQPAGSRWCTTASSRTSPSCGPGSRPTTTCCSPRPTPRWPRTCSSCRCSSGVDLTTAMQRVCHQLEGAFTLVAVDAEDPTRVVAARRNSPLVVGHRRGRELPRLRRVGVHRAHPRGPRARPGPGRHDHPPTG